MQSEAVLQIQIRPLRLVYLVSSNTDLLDAIKIYTHLWGGFSNTILPTPCDASEYTEFENSLHAINPDYILLPNIDINHEIIDLIERIPGKSLSLSMDKIEEVIDSSGNSNCFPVRGIGSYQYVNFPHIRPILNSIYSGPLSNSRLRLIQDNSAFNTEIMLQFGKPGNRYRSYLQNHFNTDLIVIKSEIDLLKISLLSSIGIFKTSIDLTKHEILQASSWSLFEIESHEKVFNLFLDSDNLHLLCNFWNSRRFEVNRSNKIIISRRYFLSNLRECILLVSSFFPSMSHFRVHDVSNSSDSEELAHKIYSEFQTIHRDIYIEIIYQKIGFSTTSGGVYSGKVISTTRDISAIDKSIRFNPTPPSGYEKSSVLFGYNARVEFSDGKYISIPTTQFSAVLLSNSKNKINDLGSSLDSFNSIEAKLQPVRSSLEGITGVAISNEECQIYIPEDKDVISKWFKAKGFNIKANEHTRYAEGFIKRFGGLNETKSLVDSGGMEIFIALNSPGSEQCGSTYDQILGFLAKNSKLKDKDAKALIDRNLPRLLKVGLIYRGCPLSCPACGLKDWYKLDKLNELIECVGCSGNFQIEDLKKVIFSYRPNELASRFLKSDGPAILEAISFFHWLSRSGCVQLGGEVSVPKEKSNFAEIDILILIKNIMILVECKSCREVNESKIVEIEKHLRKLVQTALRVDAQIVVLGVTTTSFSDELYARIATIEDESSQQGIRVHLLINRKFYILSQNNRTEIEAHMLRIEDLLVFEEPIAQNHSVFLGEPVTKYYWGNDDQLCDRDLLESWVRDLGSAL